MVKLARRIEKQRAETAKVKCDIKVMLYCKKNKQKYEISM